MLGRAPRTVGLVLAVSGTLVGAPPARAQEAASVVSDSWQESFQAGRKVSWMHVEMRERSSALGHEARFEWLREESIPREDGLTTTTTRTECDAEGRVLRLEETHEGAFGRVACDAERRPDGGMRWRIACRDSAAIEGETAEDVRDERTLMLLLARRTLAASEMRASTLDLPYGGLVPIALRVDRRPDGSSRIEVVDEQGEIVRRTWLDSAGECVREEGRQSLDVFVESFRASPEEARDPDRVRETAPVAGLESEAFADAESGVAIGWPGRGWIFGAIAEEPVLRMVAAIHADGLLVGVSSYPLVPPSDEAGLRRMGEMFARIRLRNDLRQENPRAGVFRAHPALLLDVVQARYGAVSQRGQMWFVRGGTGGAIVFWVAPEDLIERARPLIDRAIERVSLPAAQELAPRRIVERLSHLSVEVPGDFDVDETRPGAVQARQRRGIAAVGLGTRRASSRQSLQALEDSSIREMSERLRARPRTRSVETEEDGEVLLGGRPARRVVLLVRGEMAGGAQMDFRMTMVSVWIPGHVITLVTMVPDYARDPDLERRVRESARWESRAPTTGEPRRFLDERSGFAFEAPSDWMRLDRLSHPPLFEAPGGFAWAQVDLFSLPTPAGEMHSELEDRLTNEFVALFDGASIEEDVGFTLGGRPARRVVVLFTIVSPDGAVESSRNYLLYVRRPAHVVRVIFQVSNLFNDDDIVRRVLETASWEGD